MRGELAAGLVAALLSAASAAADLEAVKARGYADRIPMLLRNEGDRRIRR